MNTSTWHDERPATPCDIRRVTFQVDLMRVHLEEGQVLIVPIRLYPRFQFATMPDRRNYRLIAGGKGIYWPDMDEDISLQGLLARQTLLQVRQLLAQVASGTPVETRSHDNSIR